MNSCYVICGGPCGRTVYEGGQPAPGGDEITGLPFGEIELPDGETMDLRDGDALLTAYADANCEDPACPNTTAAREATRAQDPAVMAATIADLLARVEALEAGT